MMLNIGHRAYIDICKDNTDIVSPSVINSMPTQS